MARGRKKTGTPKANTSGPAKIYGNAQELAGMVFGYDIATDEGKSAIDGLLTSYQSQSEGQYILKNGVYVKETPKAVFDSERFFTDMDTMLGFGQGDFEGVTTASMDIKKNRELLEQQIQQNVFYDDNGNVSNINMGYDEQGNLHRNKGVKDTASYQEKVYNQHNTAINQAAIDYEKETRQAVKDAQEARKPRNKASIDDIRKTPDLLLGIPEGKQRELADRTLFGSGKNKDVFAGIGPKQLNKQALDNFSAKTLTDTDFLFKIDASDDALNAVYHNINNKSWQDDFIRKQYNAGAYKDKYGFSAKKAKDLTEEQMDLLRHDFDGNLRKFNDAFETVSLDETAIDGKGRAVNGKQYINRSYSAAGARQNYMQRTYFNGVDPNSENFGKAFTNAIDKVNSDTQVDALKAYQDYARETFNKADTTRLQSAEEFMRERLSKQEAKQASKVLGQEMGDTGKALMKGLGKEGIDTVSRFKGLKVAAGIAGGLVALWGLSEVYDE